ncbi:NRAMP family divalent metal transporter [Desulfovibrio sp. Fe33]|uniref:NRAMP family divalent metal transporter n=1 Tax=Desulfovibrio sp. Fe33 TaxID=3020842 RepID=UPI00234C7ED1|nr:divalent metal cation transporter [Desulfovibrio sp. Fe33]
MKAGECKKKRRLINAIGPGLLYAAAAVGVSHLVQATRAGANYGLGLTVVVIAACLLKYPGLRFGGIYSAATGESLIASYRREGWCAFLVYSLAQLFSMFFVIAALSLFTSGLVQAALNIQIGSAVGAAGMLALVILMLNIGQYGTVERITKYIVAIFSVLIATATILVVPKIEWSLSAFALPKIDATLFPFLLALIGFMPSPTDASALQSLWTCARATERCERASQKDAAFDFNFGYSITILTAMCFLFLGAGVLHTPGIELATTNFGFARQLMTLFTETVGAWSLPIIALASISVMFSTLYSVVDGYARIVLEVINYGLPQKKSSRSTKTIYTATGIVLCSGAVVILATMMKSFSTFMDLASTIVFITSPILAILNHRAVFGSTFPKESQPNSFMKAWSIAGILFLAALTVAYFCT